MGTTKISLFLFSSLSLFILCGGDEANDVADAEAVGRERSELPGGGGGRPRSDSEVARELQAAFDSGALGDGDGVGGGCAGLLAAEAPLAMDVVDDDGAGAGGEFFVIGGARPAVGVDAQPVSDCAAQQFVDGDA